jgi:hypothetical protein
MAAAPIGNSIREVATRADAPLTAGLLDKLKDMDAQRIARTDDIVMRKGVLALFTVVAELEARVRELESARKT